MRAPHDDQGRTVPYNAALCRATARMRRRMAEMAARIDALEAELERERIAVTVERRELTEVLEGPVAQLAGLELAQSVLRDEAITASATRKRCGTCGGLGRGFVNGLLVERIAAHCETHGLQPVGTAAEPMEEADWPHAAAGRGHYKGKALRTDWLNKSPVRRRTKDVEPPWRPPHWQAERRRNPHDIGHYYY